jgi:parallel beta-helix repeat protein
MAVTVRYSCGAISDPGRVRQNNEDRFYMDPERGIFFVIDGVGGKAAGEEAAETALSLIRARLERATGTVADRIREAITLANNEIYRLSLSNVEWEGMACVLTVAVIEGNEVTIGQVGDSRCYLVANGEIRKLTHDHSPIGEREDRGDLDELTAMRHPRRNEVFRDVGSDEHAPHDLDFVEITTAPFSSESALLLCSDGLTDLIASQQILAIMEAHAGKPQETAQALVDAANNSGGKDNITAVIVEGAQFGSWAQSVLATNSAAPHANRPAQRSALFSPIACFLYGLLFAGAAFLLAKPYWRDADPGMSLGFGSVREPRTVRVAGDIATAINRAQAGDTVVIAPGIYLEAMRLKSGVNVKAEHARESVFRVSGVAVIADNVKDARIEGLSIVSDEVQPLTVGVRVNDSNIVVEDVEISGAQIAAIEILGSSEGTFRGNQITNNAGAGIVVRDSAKPRITHNLISANGHNNGPPRPGIEILSEAQPLVMGNTFSNNAGEPIWAPQLNLTSILRQNFVPAAREQTSPVRRRQATSTAVQPRPTSRR